MEISLKEYIEKGGIVSLLKINSEKDLLNLIPDWIDKFNKSKTYCFNSNLGTIEIGLFLYEQIEFDIGSLCDHNIIFTYTNEQLRQEYYLINYKELIEHTETKGNIDMIILLNGIKLYFNDSLLICISKELCSANTTVKTKL